MFTTDSEGLLQMCGPGACELEVCAKCGKKEAAAILFNKEPETSAMTENQGSNHSRRCKGRKTVGRI